MTRHDEARGALAEQVRSIFRDPKYGHDMEWVRMNVLGAVEDAQIDEPVPTDEWEAVRVKVGGVLCNAMNFPEKVQARLLGQDMVPLIDKVTDAVLAAGPRPQGPITDAPKRRLRSCVENWPDAETGGYNPACCRFPKSCSATIYDERYVTDAALEAARDES